MEENLRSYLVEFIGTFFLVFTVGASLLLAPESIIGPIAIGLVLMIMVYAGGHVSGGHYNPAVSLSAYLTGALEKNKLIPYWASQLLGALVAVFFVRSLTLDTASVSCRAFTTEQIVISEFLFTFALCYVVLHTAVSKENAGKGFYGLAIGSTVTVGAFAVGGIVCFGAFNPAVAVGLGALKVAGLTDLAITAFANLIAATLAAYTYRFITGDK